MFIIASMTKKRIGLLGGTTPESTVSYYLYLTREYTKRHGDFGFPEILIYSVSFQQFMEWARSGQWKPVADKVVEVFDSLERAGADFGLFTANTPHIIFDEVASRTSLPLLSIVDVTVEAVRGAEIKRVGLLGTATTMDSQMYPDALDAHGIETIVPDQQDRELLSRIIYEELSSGIIKDESRREYLRIMGELEERGVQGIILGCTEIPLLIKQGDIPIPLFDTTSIHAERALQIATGQSHL
jgi:aspartate racemase